MIADAPKSARLEYRIAGADVNPYLTAAAALASGLEGIEEQRAPTKPIERNAYEHKSVKGLELPSTLWEAAQKFKRTKVAERILEIPLWIILRPHGSGKSDSSASTLPIGSLNVISRISRPKFEIRISIALFSTNDNRYRLQYKNKV